MGKIVILDELTSNQIAAGEVVERPASIAKELIENSLDAKATSITVEIKNGGISYFKITDNGVGFAKDDMVIAFERHATSKIRSAEDLNAINSFGFRGEALASIASVATVELTSRTKDDDTGKKVVIKGGQLISEEEVGVQAGTTLIVKELFYNTPARYKFLKKDSTEAGYIEDIIQKLALTNPHVSFKYINEGKVILQTSGDGNILNCVYNIFGKTIAKSVVTFDTTFENIRLNGVLGLGDVARGNRTHEIFFVNSRYIKNKTITSAVENAYQTIVPIGKFPFAIVNIELTPNLVDVNVHPTKTEVRFSDENLIYRAVYHVLRETLLKKDLVPTLDPEVTDEVNEEIEELEKKVEQPKSFLAGYEKKSFVDLPKDFKPSTKPYGYSGTKQFTPSYTFKERTETITPQASSFVPKPITVSENKVVKERNETLFTPETQTMPEKNYKFIGILFSTYIIIQQGEEFYIIDQHAAHERVMYEKILKKIKSGVKNKQILLIPEIIEIKNNEWPLIEANMELFNNTGFELEQFGGNSVKISAVPSEITGSSIKDVFMELLDSLQKESGVREEEKIEYFIFTMACKAAVKANMNLDPLEVESLLDQMMSLENPFTCPHGRPTAIKMTKYELEKKFHRIK
ncbi:MAG: DNA mismatch repair endonuclease MutL [Clostridia bacterium]|nr:DNA mismatch repair endonuclease MutL [Clostridia bacterium]